MSKKERPPLAGLSNDDDLARIRAYGLSRGFLPTDTAAPATAAPSVPAPSAATPANLHEQPPPPLPVPPPVIRPAPTKPWQAMFPDYLIEELRHAAAREGTAQKVIVMRALRAAGFRVDDIDLQDLRRR
jgi:hypothetical protein